MITLLSNSTSLPATLHPNLSLFRAKGRSVLILGSFSEAGFAIKQAGELGLSGVRWVLDGSAVSRAIVPIIGNADGIRGYFNNSIVFPARPSLCVSSRRA